MHSSCSYTSYQAYNSRYFVNKGFLGKGSFLGIKGLSHALLGDCSWRTSHGQPVDVTIYSLDLILASSNPCEMRQVCLSFFFFFFFFKSNIYIPVPKRSPVLHTYICSIKMKRETTPNPQVNLPPESLRMPSPVETGGLADIEGSYRPPHSPAPLHQWCAPDPA
jgi:hypothetical protein